MATLLTDHVARDPLATAIVDGAGRCTWQELDQRVDRGVRLLRGAGLGPGDRLACVLGNSRRPYELLLACLHAGVTLVPVNWHLTAPEVAHIVADSGCAALVVDPEHAPVAARALELAGPDVRPRRWVTGDRDVAGFAAVERAAAGAGAGPETCGSVMLYTSGTTGAPKGVDNGLFVVGTPLERVGRTAAFARSVLGVPDRGAVLLDGPWYHSSQLFFSLLPLLLGAHLVVRPRFDAAETLRVIDAERVVAAHLVPTQLVRLLRLDPAVRARFSGASIRMVWHGSGPCPRDVKRRMIEWWGPVLTEYYGATESGAVTTIASPEWLRRPGSVGRALPTCELLVVDAEGQPLPAGRTGRVFVRTRRASFQYHNAPEKTRAAFLEPGTFTIGEIGHLDDEGYLYLDGRAQELIVSGGVNVYPVEVEAVLVTHPAVADVAVVGLPDDEFGERVVAVVEPAAGASADRAALAVALDRHCRASLAGFKVPRAYHVLAELPREPTGKLRRDTLRAALVAS